MKKVLCSTFGTLVVAAFLAITPPMYAGKGHGGGHGGHRGGHAVKHAGVGHFKGGKHIKGGRYVRAARGYGRYAGRAYNWNGGRYWGGRNWNGGRYWGGRNWGGSYWYPSYGYYGLGYGYPYYGGYYGPYSGYYPYRYGNWWPSVTFSFY